MIGENSIFGYNNAVFLDGSALFRDSDWFKSEVRLSPNYQGLDNVLLKDILEQGKDTMLKVCDDDNHIRFTPGVIREIKSFCRLLNHKYDYLEKTRPRNFVNLPEAIKSRSLFRDIQKVCICLTDLAEFNSCDLSGKGEYDEFHNTLVRLCKINNLKNKRHWLKEEAEKKAKKAYASTVDEEIVASAICYGLEHNLECGIVTSDDDLRKIMIVGIMYMLRTQKFPDILANLETKPVWIYNRSKLDIPGRVVHIDSREVIGNYKGKSLDFFKTRDGMPIVFDI